MPSWPPKCSMLGLASTAFLLSLATSALATQSMGRALGRRALLQDHLEGLHAATDDMFWVFTDDGVHVIDPLGNKTKRVIASADVCLSNPCSWGHPTVIGRNVVIASYTRSSGKILVFDQHTGELVADVPTCPKPYRLGSAPWRGEVYVHCWVRDSGSDDEHVDVLSAHNWEYEYPLVDALASDRRRLQGDVVINEAYPDIAWSTNSVDPGIHAINMATRLSRFISLADADCTGTSYLGISSVNRHGFLRCNVRDDAFVLEVDLDTHEVVTPSLKDANGDAIRGIPYVTKDGAYMIVVPEEAQNQHKLYVFKAQGQGDQATLEQTIDESNQIEGLSKLAFLEKTSDPASHLAIVTSATDNKDKNNKVMLVDMDQLSSTKVLQLPDGPTIDGNSTVQSETSIRGSRMLERYVAAGVLQDGRMVALVSAQRLNTTYVIDLGSSGTPLSDVSTSNVHTVEGVPGNSPRLLFVSSANKVLPSAPATAASMALLEDKVRDLERSVMGADQSNRFWVFTDGGMHVIDPLQSKVQHTVSNATLCDGLDCGWGNPKTDGKSYIAVANMELHEVFAFDLHTGHLMARVPTCRRPFHIDPAPWRDEIIVRCWARPEGNDTPNRDGIIDVVSTKSWRSVGPLMDAVDASSAESRGHVSGSVFVSPAFPDTAWATNYYDPGYHKINLQTHQSTFIRVDSSLNCAGTSAMAISSVNRHGYVDCAQKRDGSGDDATLEINLDTDEVVQKHSVPGDPKVTGDGKFVAAVNTNEHKLHVFKARAQGQPSSLQTVENSNIDGFSTVDFILKPGVHVAVVTSTTMNKVLLVDMENGFNTTVLSLPDDPSNPGESTVPNGGHPRATRYVACGVLQDGHMMAVVSAQKMNTVHVIDMGVGSDPLADISEADVHSVEGVSGSRPMSVHAPASSASAGLLRAARSQIIAMSEQNEELTQRVSSLEEELFGHLNGDTPSSGRRRRGSGAGSQGGGSGEDDARAIAIAGVVIACVALAVMIVAIAAFAVKAGAITGGSCTNPCVGPREPSYERFNNVNMRQPVMHHNPIRGAEAESVRQ